MSRIESQEEADLAWKSITFGHDYLKRLRRMLEEAKGLDANCGTLNLSGHFHNVIEEIESEIAIAEGSLAAFENESEGGDGMEVRLSGRELV